MMDGEKNKCSNCKRYIQEGANYLLHELHCKRKVELCKKCGSPVLKAEMEQHIQVEHTSHTCELCGERVPRHELNTHEKTECLVTTVKCKYCELELPRMDCADHMDRCGIRTEPCELCQQWVMLKEMDKHKKSKCRHKVDHAHDPSPALSCRGSQQVKAADTCDFCGEKVPQNKLETHKKTSCLVAMVTCDYCALEVSRLDCADHMDQCGSRTDFCEVCHQWVMLKNMNEHKKNSCRLEEEAGERVDSAYDSLLPSSGRGLGKKLGRGRRKRICTIL